MHYYAIHKTGKQYVVRAEGKDVLIRKSRREAEQIIYDANGLLEELTWEGQRCTENAE